MPRLKLNWPRHTRTALLIVGALAAMVTLARLYPRTQIVPLPPPASATPRTASGAAAVPAATRGPSPSPTPRVRVTPTPGPVNLNQATKEELLDLPGIGEVRAVGIMESRERDGRFQTPEDIVTRRIVPRAIFDRIRDRLTVQ